MHLVASFASLLPLINNGDSTETFPVSTFTLLVQSTCIEALFVGGVSDVNEHNHGY